MVRLLCQGWGKPAGGVCGAARILSGGASGSFGSLLRRPSLPGRSRSTGRGLALLRPHPYFGLQILALLALGLLVNESHARQRWPGRTPSFWRSSDLSESSRLGERVRISQDLHDASAITHRSVAQPGSRHHQAEGPAVESLCHRAGSGEAAAGDVRDIVRVMRKPGRCGAAPSSRCLPGRSHAPHHLDVPATLFINDPARAHVLGALRNKRSSPMPFAIRMPEIFGLRSRSRALASGARADDGRGAARSSGMGLSGMRDRLGMLGAAWSSRRPRYRPAYHGLQSRGEGPL